MLPACPHVLYLGRFAIMPVYNLFLGGIWLVPTRGRLRYFRCY